MKIQGDESGRAGGGRCRGVGANRLAAVLACCLTGMAGLWGTGGGALAAMPGAVPAALARERFVVESGLAVGLVAAEPLVRSPAALGWDENGRLFVAENAGYPVGPGPGMPPVGAVTEMVDDDGDGRVDRRVEFAGGLQFPNGLMPWRGGWLVTDAPDLMWLADTNRDGRADVREVWWTGFATNSTTQLRACYPVLGADGWIYVARGLSGGVVRSPKWTNLPPVDMNGGDFRFRPDGSAAEVIGGNTQFGQVLDDVGRRFAVSNRNPLMHAVVLPRWWARNPWLPFTELVQDVSPVGYEAKVHPTSADLTTAGFIPDLLATPHAGTFTAACGIHQYFGEGLGAGYDGSWFVCEPAQNLVQRQVAEAVGGTFRSRAVPTGRDFLTSTDPWFRPVFLATGPDGALYIADLYRRIIDHPAYLPEDVRGKLDFDAGKDLGRVWRIAGPAGGMPASELPGRTNAVGWVRMLDSRNGWVRQTAYRLLLEPGAAAFVDPILAVSGEEVMAPGRMDAWTNIVRRVTERDGGPPWGRARRIQLLGLAAEDRITRGGRSRGLDARVNSAAVGALFDESPMVRLAAWRVLQRIVALSRSMGETRGPLPDVPYALVYWWADDPDPAVRFEFALTCGEQRDWSPVIPALVRIARRDGADRWTRAAVLSGLKDREAQFLEELWREPMASESNPSLLMEDLGRMIAANPTRSPGPFLEAVLGPVGSGRSWQASALRGVASGWRGRGHGSLKELVRELANRGGQGGGLPGSLEEIGSRSAREAETPSLEPERRVGAIQLLAELDLAAGGGGVLSRLVEAAGPVEVRVAAVHALARQGDGASARRWVERGRWSELPGPVREAALSELTTRAGLLPELFGALERGDLPLWVVEPGRRRQLQAHGDPVLRARAKRLWAGEGSADRHKAYEEWRGVVTMAAEGGRGREVFLKACAPCHQRGGEGSRVGPDLTGIRNQPAEALLLHILVPDAEIAAGFQATEIETRDGRSLAGLVVGESEQSVTLRRAGGEEEILQRSGIVARSLSRLSLMPQELEKTMSRQEMADLLAFLKGTQ